MYEKLKIKQSLNKYKYIIKLIMGIPNFFKLFEQQKEIVKFENFKNKILIIDAFLEIYRSALAVPFPLKNSKGELTSHINTIFQNIVKFKQLNITPIFVFDQASCKLKRGVLYKRKEKRDKAIEEIKKIDDLGSCIDDKTKDKKNKLFKSAFVINSEIIDEIIFLLEKMGITYVMTPKGYESEQYAAKLVKEGKGYAVLTTDADALLFGATRVIKRERKGKLSLYKLDRILKENEINQQQLIEIGVSLGCDFATKVPRVGIKTVMKKVKGNLITFDKLQLKAIDYFNCKVPNSKYINNKHDDNTLHDIYSWLTLKKEFNSTRVFNILKKYGYEGKKIEFKHDSKNRVIIKGSSELNNINDDDLISLILNNN